MIPDLLFVTRTSSPVRKLNLQKKRFLKSPVTQQPLKVQRIFPNGFTLVNLTNIPPLQDLLSDTDKSSTAPAVSNIVKKPARRSLAFTGSSLAPVKVYKMNKD